MSAVDASRIVAAISYYGDYVGEIDAEITEADKASVRAEARGSARDGVLASRPIRLLLRSALIQRVISELPAAEPVRGPESFQGVTIASQSPIYGRPDGLLIVIDCFFCVMSSGSRRS